MPWPVFDQLWRHESYQAPLLSDRIADLMSFRETGKSKKKKCFTQIKTKSLHIPLCSL